MDRRTRGILVGMSFGDAYINVRNRLKDGKYKYQSAEMRVLHSLDQADYCHHKAALLKSCLGGNFSVKEVKNGPGGKYKALAFSVSNKYFRLLKRWIYPGGTKTFTKFTLDMLTPEGIALWYMDDGHPRVNINAKGFVSSCSTSIATMCSEQEITDIIEWFKDKHHIEFKPRFDKRMSENKNWFIEANTENSRWFAHLVQPFIIPSMLYKLRHVADLNLQERRTPIGACVCGATIFDNRRKNLCAACYAQRYYRKHKKKSVMI